MRQLVSRRQLRTWARKLSDDDLDIAITALLEVKGRKEVDHA